MLSPAARQVLQHPAAFLLAVGQGFFRNQGLLLAGAIAYYALLSAVPLLALAVIVISHALPAADLLEFFGRYLEWLVPSQSRAVLADVGALLENRAALGWLLLASMIFFSSLAFSVLEKAVGIIFAHRAARQKRAFLVSAVLPYCLVLALGLALLILSGAALAVERLAEGDFHFLGRAWSLGAFSGPLLYGLGFAFEALLLAGLYLALPVGGLRLSHAALGGMAAAVLWEFLRRGLGWYFVHLSRAGLVYGSLTTAVVVLFSLEIAATVLLLGAQVIAEYEKIAEAAADLPADASSLSGEERP